MDEGTIKYGCTWVAGPPPQDPAVGELCRWRDALAAAGLVGHDAEHDVGFGNVSLRAGRGVLISGTGTGHVPALGAEHIARITEHDIDRNRLRCEGPVQASSESLSHMALYELGAHVGAVAHVHHAGLWAALRDEVPATDPEAAYGTPAMAHALARLARAAPEGGILRMQGHPDGLVAYGPSLEDAARRLVEAAAQIS